MTLILRHRNRILASIELNANDPDLYICRSIYSVETLFLTYISLYREGTSYYRT